MMDQPTKAANDAAHRNGDMRPDKPIKGAPRREKTQKDVDDTLDDSFPASDPPSYNPGATKKHN